MLYSFIFKHDILIDHNYSFVWQTLEEVNSYVKRWHMRSYSCLTNIIICRCNADWEKDTELIDYYYYYSPRFVDDVKKGRVKIIRLDKMKNLSVVKVFIWKNIRV